MNNSVSQVSYRSAIAGQKVKKVEKVIKALLCADTLIVPRISCYK